MNCIYRFMFWLPCLLLPKIALAHSIPGVAGLYDGLSHPITGLDHLLAIFFVGVIASQENKEEAWKLPTLFAIAIFLGGLVGVTHVHLPFVDVMVNVSLVAIGLLVAFGLKISSKISFPLVSIFAFFHGHAHGIEAAPYLEGLSFGLGFMITTTILLAGGFYLGQRVRQTRFAGPILNYSGGALVVVGIVLTTAILS